MTHICVGKQTIICSDNVLSPGRRQAIIWTNARLLLIWQSRTNFSEISIKILIFSFTKMRLKVSSAKWRPFCLGLNVLTQSLPMRDHVIYVMFSSISWDGAHIPDVKVILGPWCYLPAKHLSVCQSRIISQTYLNGRPYRISCKCIWDQLSTVAHKNGSGLV